MTTLERTTSALEAIEQIAPIIREYADQSEREATLARPIVDALIEHGLFRQLTPKSLGGAEVDPVTWFKTVEAAARIDGSTGWCLFINGGTGFIGSRMTEEAAEELIANPATIIAGGVFPFGRAEVVEGGYRVTGRWPFSSGCKHSTIIGGMCVVFDGQAPRMTPMGPELRMCGLPAEQVEIIDNWEVSGLTGTGSHDFALNGAFVPERYAINMLSRPENRYYTGPLYAMPFISLFGLPMAAVALGIAQHSIDVMLEVAQTKVPAAMAATDPKPLQQRPLFHLQLGEAMALVRSARAWMHEALNEAFEVAKAGQPADMAVRNNLYSAASNATRSSRQAVELMYLAGGGGANYRKSPLQRCLRDIFALTQHAATSPQSLENSGAMFAGLPAPLPLLLL